MMLFKMATWVAHALASVTIFSIILRVSYTSTTKAFIFPEYPYKETSKNELLFREFEQACEENGGCKLTSQQKSNVAKIKCIRECVSPSCYREIYLFDQLEEGEIDVRLNSFKGCFMQKYGKPRK